MGLFSRKQEVPEVPVDRRKVMKLAAALMAERDAEESPALPAAVRKVSEAYKGTTQAERRAASAITRRNGY